MGYFPRLIRERQTAASSRSTAAMSAEEPAPRPIRDATKFESA